MTRLCIWTFAALAITGCGEEEDPSFELVGHSPLLARGMNAAPAVIGDYLYVGSRTEGGTHDDAGVLIVDVSDPANPQVAGQIGPPEQALLGMTSRELRAVPDKNWLIVMNFACSTDIHACTRDVNQFGTRGTAETNNIRIYDVSNPTSPALISRTQVGSVTVTAATVPHEFFLWRDPNDADRILLFMSTPLGPPSFRILDISDPTDVQTLVTWDPFQEGLVDEPPGSNALLHSVTASEDGHTAYLSMTGAGVSIIDTSEVIDGVQDPAITGITTPESRVDYSPPWAPGTHSTVTIPGRDLLLVTDEVYPVPVSPGCPWGWARMVDIADPANPTIVGEYKMQVNDPEVCPQSNGPEFVTYTAHNPTVTENLALITWHSGGLRLVDTTDPTAMETITTFKPDPLPSVNIEDPALGGDPLLMWSYPIIKDGLIYVVDIRNGLYILRYHGPYDEQIAETAFNEGNSNLR